MKGLDVAESGFSRVVVKHKSNDYVGVERVNLSNYVIGMVLSGKKYIQQDDRVMRVGNGDIFFMGVGSHFVEDVPTQGKAYEQIAFQYNSAELQQAVMLFNGDISNAAVGAGESVYENVSVEKPSRIVANIFLSADVHYRSQGFVNDTVSGCLKLAELANAIVKHQGGAIQKHMLLSLDSVRTSFEAVIYKNIFRSVSIEDLAKESCRSLTTFKKEFDRYFGTPPHQWFQHQRLNYACFLLSMTDYTIAHIGEVCVMPNPSHFIKLFKRSYGTTPALYRAQKSLYRSSRGLKSEDEECVS